MKKFLLPALCAVLTAGCANIYLDTIQQYSLVADQVELGASVAQVREILDPTQVGLTAKDLKRPERFKKDGKEVLILFYRSGWQDDGITTDDEFTPYIFEDGVLKAIGWTPLGGPKTQGQVKPEVNVESPTWGGHFMYRYY